MKTVQFETPKVFGLFLKLPNGAINVKVRENLINGRLSVLEYNRDVFDLPQRDWQLQGFLTNLTDEQKEAVVPNVDMTGYEKLFPNYLDDEGTLFMDIEPSFETLLESLKVFAVNPYGEHQPYVSVFDNNLESNANMLRTNWKTAQQYVGNYILLTANK